MKASTLKGTRDFLPQDVRRRNYIFNTIRSVFESYGYQPIETPTMEGLETLTGKYGEEGDRLIFKILNNGEFLGKVNEQDLANRDYKKLTPAISKRALRYDLTVPFARFVVQHRNDIHLPFKRYQIQPVWRADRPQKGRYNEFYQCDVDVVGSKSLMYEAELVKIYDEVFHKLAMKVEILVNNRKVLQGIADAAGISDKFMEMTIVIDKLDKIGEDKVIEELQKKEIDLKASKHIMEMLKCKSLKEMKQHLSESETGMKGIEELKNFHEYLDQVEAHNSIRFDPSLARGLNYYTGCIFEVKTKEYDIGSVGGGGRYDDLTAVFGVKDLSGVGISFGAARIYDVMKELDLFPEEISEGTKVLFVSLDKESHVLAFQLADKLRAKDISCTVYPESVKMKKQMSYADNIKVPYTIIIGEEERQNEKYVLKNMKTGEQNKFTFEDLLENIK